MLDQRSFKKAHSSFRPDGDEIKSLSKEGMPIPYTLRVFREEEVAAVSSTLDFWKNLVS